MTFRCPDCGPVEAAHQDADCPTCGLDILGPLSLAPRPPHPEAIARAKVHADLQAILAAFVANFPGPRWDGCEYAKAWIGNALMQAVRETRP